MTSAATTGGVATGVRGTAPYPWPWDGCLAPARLVLLVAGWTVGWRQASTGDAHGARAARHIAALVAAMPSGGHVLASVPARDPFDDPRPLPLRGAHTIASAGVDGFYGSALDANLRAAGRTHLLLVGHGLEGPVHSTLRAANDRGYECLLVADACTSADPALRAAAVSTVTMSGGVFGAVGATAAVLSMLASLPDTTSGGCP